MRNGRESLRDADLIRGVARGLAGLPFTGNAMVEACQRLELAGIPAHYCLRTTAQDYALFLDNEHLAALLAARVGDPRISPTPPLWPLLSLLLLGWRDKISPERVLEQAAGLELEGEARRGLAIIAYLFPELRGCLASAHSRMPLWERALAVPLAARKLVMLEKLD